MSHVGKVLLAHFGVPKSLMARIHPSFPLHAPATLGAYRERDILKLLEQGLDNRFDVFHNLPWSGMQGEQQNFGEYDFVIVSPGGQLLILEIKSGDVTESDDGLTKQYGRQGPKDIGHQMRRMHSSLLQRIDNGELPQVHVGAMLVLPDYKTHGAGVGYPPERMVDASQIDQLCQRISASFPAYSLPEDQRQRVLDFLANRFEVQPDVATHIGQVQQATTQLASGLATWVPRITHAEQLYQIEATAGSGKTQLALALLAQAAAQGRKARYVCFNRPLADHLARLAPTRCEVTTFHQLCRDHAENQGLSLDFADAKVFERITQKYLEDAITLPARLDLLILDESQDLNPAWVDALSQALLPDGQLYVMGDSQQQLYEREPFSLSSAVQVRCMDNFRSPQRVVHMINKLGLTPEPVLARSAHAGEVPHFHIWEAGQSSAQGKLNECLAKLWQSGYTPEQVAVISYRGVQQSEVLRQDRLGGQATRRFTGQYDSAGNAQWREGPVLAESLYRFKGQSAPAVVLCEVDFETLTERDKRKLFVGLTRAQMRVDVVLSERAARALTEIL
jgi:hypothetical protein